MIEQLTDRMIAHWTGLVKASRTPAGSDYIEETSNALFGPILVLLAFVGFLVYEIAALLIEKIKRAGRQCVGKAAQKEEAPQEAVTEKQRPIFVRVKCNTGLSWITTVNADADIVRSRLMGQYIFTEDAFGQRTAHRVILVETAQ